MVELRYASPEAQEAALARLHGLAGGNGAERIEPLPDRLLIYTDSGDVTAAHVTRADGADTGGSVDGDGVDGDGAEPASVLVRRSSLEDVFLRLTGRTLVLPLFMFSGTFFPLENLPAAVRPVAWATPLWHAVELARGATTGSIGLGAVALHLAYLVAVIALAAAWGARTFTRRLTP